MIQAISKHPYRTAGALALSFAGITVAIGLLAGATTVLPQLNLASRARQVKSMVGRAYHLLEDKVMFGTAVGLNKLGIAPWPATDIAMKVAPALTKGLLGAATTATAVSIVGTTTLAGFGAFSIYHAIGGRHAASQK